MLCSAQISFRLLPERISSRIRTFCSSLKRLLFIFRFGFVSPNLPFYPVHFSGVRPEEIAWNLRRHDQLFTEGGSVDGIVDFFVGLTEYDEWFLDLFIAVCLKKDRLQNVSPKLNQYFSSKPESLAGKLRMGLSVASLPKQKLPLEKIMEVNQRTPKAVYGQQSTSKKTQTVKLPPDESKSPSETPRSPRWFYWVLGALILGGVGVLVWNSRKCSSAG